jgi:hypothetical protein
LHRNTYTDSGATTNNTTTTTQQQQQQQLPPRNSFFPRRKTTTALASQFLGNSAKTTRWIPAPECKRDYTSSNRMAWQMD